MKKTSIKELRLKLNSIFNDLKTKNRFYALFVASFEVEFAFPFIDTDSEIFKESLNNLINGLKDCLNGKESKSTCLRVNQYENLLKNNIDPCEVLWEKHQKAGKRVNNQTFFLLRKKIPHNLSKNRITIKIGRF